MIFYDFLCFFVDFAGFLQKMLKTAKIAKKIGKKNQKKFFEKIGFNKKINFEIIEAAKPLGNRNNWGRVETMTIGYGHGFAVTPLHLVKAYASIINNGIKVKPTLVKNNFYTSRSEEHTS